MPPKDPTNAYLAKRIDSLEATITSLDNAIRGHNGEPGLIARLALLERAVLPLAGLSQDYIELKSDMAVLDNNLSVLAKNVESHHAAQREDEIREKTQPRTQVLESRKEEKDKSKEFGTWPWFRDNYLDKLIMTIITVIITAVVLYILQRSIFGVP